MAKNLENITYFLVVIAVLWYLSRSTLIGEDYSNRLIVQPFVRKTGLG